MDIHKKINMKNKLDVEELARLLTDTFSVSEKRENWNIEDKKFHYLMILTLSNYIRIKLENGVEL